MTEITQICVISVAHANFCASKLHESTVRGVLTLELVAERPDWVGALRAALTLPPGITERRTGQDPWASPPISRPLRISDDLGWLRAAIDEPEAAGLREIDGTAAVAIWEAGDDDSEPCEHLRRLDQRGVLGAAGFLLGGVPVEASSE